MLFSCCNSRPWLTACGIIHTICLCAPHMDIDSGLDNIFGTSTGVHRLKFTGLKLAKGLPSFFTLSNHQMCYRLWDVCNILMCCVVWFMLIRLTVTLTHQKQTCCKKSFTLSTSSCAEACVKIATGMWIWFLLDTTDAPCFLTVQGTHSMAIFQQCVILYRDRDRWQWHWQVCLLWRWERLGSDSTFSSWDVFGTLRGQEGKW